MHEHGQIIEKIDNDSNLLVVSDLKTYFRVDKLNTLRAVDGISYKIKTGRIHGLVGESGCGKTVAALSILRLIDHPGYIAGGEIVWRGQDILKHSDDAMRKIRGKEIAMIFQDPVGALNPVSTIQKQMSAILKVHGRMNTSRANDKALRLLKEVNMPDPEKHINDYPHQLSGGMCQRITIAIALSCEPRLLIADEPTTALDVTIQAQILDLLLELREKHDMSILLISHDMGVVAKMCDSISVMYLGKVVEEASAQTFFSDPLHPYSRALLRAIPILDPAQNKKTASIRGELPSAIHMSLGCVFYTRCEEAKEICKTDMPSLREVGNGHKVACWLYN